MRERMLDFIQDKAVHPGNYLCFGHGGALCSLTYELGLDVVIPPGSVVGLRYDSESSEQMLNLDFVWEHPKMDLSQTLN